MQSQSANSIRTTADGVAWLPFMLNPRRDPGSEGSTARLATSVFDALVAVFAQPLLSSQTPEELADAIDELLENPEFGASYRRTAVLFFQVVQMDARVPPPAEISAAWGPRLSAADVTKLERVLSFAMALAAAHLQHWARLQEPSERHETKPLLGFLEDWNIPVDVKRIWMDSLRAEVCMFALSAALHESHAQPAWLITQLLATAESGYWNHLRLVAAFEESQIDPTLVPPSERVDIATLREIQIRHRLSTELLTLKHIQSGEALISPFSEIAPADE